MTEDLAQNYRRAFGKRIGFGKRPALIMIDFVEAYFDTACALYADVAGLAKAFFDVERLALELA